MAEYTLELIDRRPIIELLDERPALELVASGPVGTGDGVPGPPGERGLPGVDGIDGINGTNGIDGVDGAPGINGERGLPGIDGIDGQPGAPGINGTNGTNGLDGAAGIQGPAGERGLPGLDGMNGVDGAPGIQGIPGIQGPAGASASLPTGGATGTVLTKASSTNGDVIWTTTTRGVDTSYYVEVSRASGTQSMPSGAWTTVTMPTVTVNSSGLAWSTVNNTYTIPQTGLYFIDAKCRLSDNPVQVDAAFFVHTSNDDGAWGKWTRLGPTRTTLTYTRVGYFTAGQALRGVFRAPEYGATNALIQAAAMCVVRLG